MTKNVVTDSNSHLAAKKRTSALGNFALLAIAMFAVHHHSPLGFDWWFVGVIATLSGARWAMPHPRGWDDRAQTRWLYAYAGLSVATGLAWGLLAALHVVLDGAGSLAGIFLMMNNAGIASAGSNSLTPNRRLAGAFTVGVLLPMMGALAVTTGDLNWPLIGLLVSAQVFLILQIGVTSAVIVQLREREEQYGTLVDASHEGIIIHENGVIVEINPGMTRMLGFTAAELHGRPLIELVHPDDRAQNLAELRLGSETPRATRALHKDGGERTVEVRGRNISYRGRAARVVCVQDMTSHSAAERARRASDEEGQKLILERERAAVEALRVRADFLANMSHEIRTPLNAIIGLSDLLEETPEGETRARYVRTLKNSGEGLLTLVNDILDFSRIDSGQIDFEYSALNLVTLVEDQCDLLASRAVAKGLTMSTYVDPNLPILVRGDSGRLGQILLNLISNAIKFTERGEVGVRCLSLGQDGEAWRVRIEVRDTGIGVPKELAHRIFRPFSQADSSMSRKFGGAGLGLSICKRLIDGMNGTMSYQSEEGAGATFWFDIPLTGLNVETFGASFGTPDATLTIVGDSLAGTAALLEYARAWSVPARLVSLTELAGLEPAKNEIVLAATGVMPTIERRPAHGFIAVDPAIRHRVSTAIAHPRRRTVPTPVRQSDLAEALLELAKPVVVEAPAPRAAAPPAAHDVFAPARILVVEDNSTNQMLIMAVLARLGLTAQAVVNGIEAVTAVESTDYDLILMDCQMPEMDGFEATRRIRAREAGTTRHIPIVALTANVSAEDRERCLACGMDGFVPKPVRRDKLIAELKNYLRGSGDEKAG